jgi:hypothetical protein
VTRINRLDRETFSTAIFVLRTMNPVIALKTERNQPDGGMKSEDAATADEFEEEEFYEAWYICRQCRNRITQSGTRIAVHGQHRHIFSNPSGIVFEIACFTWAQGYSFAGNPSTEFAWFSGFAWQIIICSQCLSHLGWHFTGDQGDHFFGLITDRVILESTPSE